MSYYGFQSNAGLRGLWCLKTGSTLLLRGANAFATLHDIALRVCHSAVGVFGGRGATLLLSVMANGINTESKGDPLPVKLLC